ncbi:MAG: hypothetical protein ACJAWV_003196 [Flammeovirgaceae bacterium]|jgi:hypothetical protein
MSSNKLKIKNEELKMSLHHLIPMFLTKIYRIFHGLFKFVCFSRASRMADAIPFSLLCVREGNLALLNQA